MVRPVSARTKYPNTRESDMQSHVMCVVNMSDGTTREVMATDPGDAITKIGEAKITAKELEQRFDEGKDVLGFFDTTKAEVKDPE